MRCGLGLGGTAMNKPPLKVYIGLDAREPAGYAVACKSILSNTRRSVFVQGLDHARLAERGLLRRPTDRRGGRYDIISNAPASTDFAISRFLVPLLCPHGWVLFGDCDIVCLADIEELFALADPKYAVMCVKHDFDTLSGTKMDGQVQQGYPRKLWSSVMLFNSDHPANSRLSLHDVNERPGKWLHGFGWLHDDEIGELPPEWNVLVGVQPVPANPKLLHFTLGTPDLPGVAPLPEHAI